ncbi:hypothetical protein KPL70_014355 [Citrus sinensis]|nr:hypothetical protein KPL70_014355 [Citrus sinensis]
MVEGETSIIGERSTKTISGNISGRRRNLSNRYLAPVIGGQKIDVEKFDVKIIFGMWRREVMDALIQIDLNDVKYLVKDEECAMTLWCTLEEKYLLKSPENRLHAMSKVYSFRMKPRVSLHDYVSRFEKLLVDLKNLDEDINDEVKVMILLHLLLEEYSHFVTTLIYGKNVIIFKDICTTLTNLEIQNNDKHSERASSEALLTRQRAMEKKKKHGGKNSRLKSRSRNFCHEKGHWSKDCPKAQKRDGKKSEAANMASKDEDSDYSLSITPTTYVASSSEWIFDIRATYHLCPIREWFTDFSELESGAVAMENDQPCHTMGIGIVRLKLFDGIVRELKEVRYILVLKKNLIFMGALEAKGYKVTIENSTIKFTYGAMVILDVWGPTKTALIGGSYYFVTFVDDFSRRVWVYTMRSKDEVLEIFMKLKKLVETQTGRKIKELQYDNGGEYTCNPFLQVCQNEDKKFWAETVSYISHLINRLPSAAIEGKTPMEMWSGKHAQDYDSLRIFRDVTFDEASKMKASSSQQVENNTTEVLQQVEFDATPYVPISSTSENGLIMEETL